SPVRRSGRARALPLSLHDALPVNWITRVNYTSFDTTCSNCTTTCDREYVLDWHQERKICQTWRNRNVVIYCFHQFHDFINPLLFAVQCTKCRTFYYWNIITWEFVER